MKLSQTSISILTGLLLALAPLSASVPPEAGDLGLKTVTIDPGHGGHDAGCVSKDGKTKEKDLALSISQKLAEKIRSAYPGVKVVLTRDDDTFIPLTERANIANRNNSDLFICVHINSTTSTSAKGFSVHVLGQSSNKNRDLFKNNMELCKRENSVILLEEDQTSYQGFDPTDPESYIFFSLMQNTNLERSLEFAEDVTRQMAAKGPIWTNRGLSQDPFWVLWKTTMPAVLIECGFISNASDLAVMKTDKGREGIAEDIFQAFAKFKKDYDGSLSVDEAVSREVKTSKEVKTANVAKTSKEVKNSEADDKTVWETAIWYGTQVIATPRQMKDSDPFFKGYKPKAVKSGSLYKYIIGTSSSLEEARKNCRKIQNSFSGSFLVKVEDGEISRQK